jgi:hypothetical protein
LIEVRDSATNETRITALCAIGFIVVCIAIVDRFVFTDRGTKPNNNDTPPAASESAA